jgi:hypothetical protein
VTSNLDRFKSDLARLIKLGQQLELAMQLDCYPEQFNAALKQQLKDKAEEYVKNLPSFSSAYQRWYSEALAVVRQLLPDRLTDFTRHYEKPKARKNITYESYRVEDYLQGLHVTRSYDGQKVVGRDAAIPQFQQQLAILNAAEARFDSSLFDIRQLVQADVLDSELEAADHLAKCKFLRAAGAIAGVVLERHLATVSSNHKVPVGKKNPTISDFNEALKTAAVIDLPQWRFIQHLADLRNICDHARTPDPTKAQIDDLLAGVKKVTKTVF